MRSPVLLMALLIVPGVVPQVVDGPLAQGADTFAIIGIGGFEVNGGSYCIPETAEPGVMFVTGRNDSFMAYLYSTTCGSFFHAPNPVFNGPGSCDVDEDQNVSCHWISSAHLTVTLEACLLCDGPSAMVFEAIDTLIPYHTRFEGAPIGVALA